MGLAFLLVGVGLCIVAAWWVRSMGSSDTASSHGWLKLLLAGGIPLGAFGTIGIALLHKGYGEEAELRKIQRRERLLSQLERVGKVNLRTWMSEFRFSRTEMIHLLLEHVAQGQVTGYVDWSTGVFYARDAERVGSNTCPHCGGVRETVGRGLVVCPHCQAELLVPFDARQTKAAG